VNVVDLDKASSFSAAVQQLESKVIDSGYDPNLIVGIPTGGRLVVDKMKKLSNKSNVCFIVKQRKSTSTKQKLGLKKFLPYLPRILNNVLRHFESWFLERKFEKVRDELLSAEAYLIDLDDETKKMVIDSKKILVVDDAIDSGQTMKVIVETIRQYNPGAEIKLAVINTTFMSPLVAPDFCLFQRQIVRYPWANDVRSR
jgi:hypoxanthine phosphoribosyltransferase